MQTMVGIQAKERSVRTGLQVCTKADTQTHIERAVYTQRTLTPTVYPEVHVLCVCVRVRVCVCVSIGLTEHTDRGLARVGLTNPMRTKQAYSVCVCVYPTRPIDETCSCMVCKRYPRSYIHNVVTKGIHSASVLVTYHNVAYMQNLTRRMRAAIKVRHVC